MGATTLDEYRQHIEKDAALERRFQQVLAPRDGILLRNGREVVGGGCGWVVGVGVAGVGSFCFFLLSAFSVL